MGINCEIYVNSACGHISTRLFCPLKTAEMPAVHICTAGISAVFMMSRKCKTINNMSIVVFTGFVGQVAVTAVRYGFKGDIMPR